MNPDLDTAKDDLRAAARRIDPLKTLREHPYATIGIAVTAGYVIGTNNHGKVVKTVRSGVGFLNTMRPALLAAGKVVGGIVASRYAAKAKAAAEQTPFDHAPAVDDTTPATASA